MEKCPSVTLKSAGTHGMKSYCAHLVKCEMCAFCLLLQHAYSHAASIGARNQRLAFSM